MPRWDMESYDWMCSQFSGEYINVGLRQDVDNRGGDFTEMMFEELAARADWAIMPYDQCNHAPVVTADALNCSAAPGAVVNLTGSVSDPDGDDLTVSWYVPAYTCKYAARTAEDGSVSEFEIPVSAEGYAARVTIPEDAQAGDVFVVNMQVKDQAERPMTRFAQFVITVE